MGKSWFDCAEIPLQQYIFGPDTVPRDTVAGFVIELPDQVSTTGTKIGSDVETRTDIHWRR